MGKASSSKKVARAAGIGGGRSHRRQTPWAYFGAIILIVALGLAGTVFSRHQRNDQIAAAGNTGAITVGAQDYEAYAVYICGKFVAPIKTPAANPQGITAWTPTSGTKAPTDGGVIQITPKSKDVAGNNATLGKFTGAVGIKLNAAELQMPGGKLYLGGDSCEGKPGYVYIKQFSSAQDSIGQLYNGAKATKTTPKQLPKLDPVDVPLKSGGILTIAFVPASEAKSIPAPSADVDNELTAAESAAASTTTTTTP
jgi:hypothetical protein